MPYVPSLEELVSRAKASVGAERALLRDEFAMAALTGLLSHDYDNMPNLAHEAYLIADAMLEAREAAT